MITDCKINPMTKGAGEENQQDQLHVGVTVEESHRRGGTTTDKATYKERKKKGR